MTVTVSTVEFGGPRLPVIAGPCVIESRDHALFMAERLRAIFTRLGVPFVFKSSYDKANRTSVNSYRGPGMDSGLKVLSEVRAELEVPVLTDVHSPAEAAAAAQAVDVIQIPAFLCRQTDLLLAAGATGACVNIKKGQFVAPADAKHIVSKVESTGNRRILLTERGTSFGYNNLVADMRAIPIVRSAGYPVVFDATHAVQHPGGLGDRSGGEREHIPILARAAVAAGCDALFMEVHDNVSAAVSDAATQWPLDAVESLMALLLRIREAVLEGQA